MKNHVKILKVKNTIPWFIYFLESIMQNILTFKNAHPLVF